MENENIQITIADLALLKNLVDVACSRGAFKAEEMSTVGQVYDKLSTFLTQIVEQVKDAPEAPSVQSGDTDA